MPLSPIASFRTSISFNLKMLALFMLILNGPGIAFFVYTGLTEPTLIGIGTDIINLTIIDIIILIGMTAFYPIKVFKSHIEGYVQSGRKTSCDWMKSKMSGFKRYGR
jgi:hypothetical protein